LRSIVERYLGPPKTKNTWFCPFHNDQGTPNLKISKDEIHFRCWSAACDKRGDVVDFVRLIEKLANNGEAARFLTGDTPMVMDVSEIMAKRQTTARERAEAQAREKGNALIRIGAMIKTAELYHQQLDNARSYWRSQGLLDWTMNRFKLGFSLRCPTYRESSSYTIPNFRDDKLLSIRHRLASPNGSGKYRPEFAGLPNQLFLPPEGLFPVQEDAGGDFIIALNKPGEALFVEGEVKVMYLSQTGYTVAGIPGAESWQAEWLESFEQIYKIYICLDPMSWGDQQRIVSGIAPDFVGAGKQVVVVDLPHKPDDFFVKHRGRVQDFGRFL
jgi:hypothetical protein